VGIIKAYQITVAMMVVQPEKGQRYYNADPL
jgi:hypothetical protein